MARTAKKCPHGHPIPVGKVTGPAKRGDCGFCRLAQFARAEGERVSAERKREDDQLRNRVIDEVLAIWDTCWGEGRDFVVAHVTRPARKQIEALRKEPI
jgi:hypothetical protein